MKPGGRRRSAWLLAAALAACAGPAALRPVSDARLAAAEREPESWLAHGRTPGEQRYSPLEQIHAGNVSRLGLAWSYDLATERGVESTPLVADGVMYVTGPWSVLHALDARTGHPLWSHDPGVPRGHARATCCGVVNRGAALYGERVYLGTLDGRLVALDRATGALAWEVQTTPPGAAYSITGAPRVIGGRVIIGNGGAEFGVRGFVSAYDAGTGELLWRTFTVPGDPAAGFESKALERAAATWSGEWWKLGGGGTVWDGMAYDPALRLLYVGTGNGSPYPRWLRSPGGGDNLYLASILALDPETGEIVWHFQTTPAETWDYTATQPLLLADLEIGGRLRRVLMQAPKNGFFYVIDRETGEFLSGAPFVPVSWARGLDPSGRPIESPDVDYRQEARFVKPSALGGHNWQPMSFSPKTGLVYLPAMDMGFPYRMDPKWQHAPGDWNTGLDSSLFSSFGSDAEAEVQGMLLAWDPVAQRAAWKVLHPVGFNGGTLATAGDLVFQGTADGRFVAYAARDGAVLWQSPASTGVMAGPVSYAVDGVQYVAVAAGWGAAFGMGGAQAARAAGVRGGGRVLAFALDAHEPVPPGRAPLGPVPEPPPLRIELTPEQREQASALYHLRCAACHGPLAIGGGSGVTDLRYLDAAGHARFADVVLGGLRVDRGMPGFADRMSRDETRWIQGWLLERAREDAARARD